jgi:hypothetical protein
MLAPVMAFRVHLGAVVLVAVGALTADALVACGSSSNATSGAGGDASSDAGSDASDAEAGPTYPSFAVDYPQVVKNQGTILASPLIVTVSWPGADMNVSTWEAFDDAIGSSSYWAAATAQYGVGMATSGASNHVHMTQPLPASLSYTEMQSFVVAALAAAEPDAGAPEAPEAGAPDPRWPAPTVDAHGDVQTIYSLFIPLSTAVTDPGSGQSFCDEGALGYHDNVVVDGTPVAYAVNLECAPLSLPDIEETAAHETIEASTDPYVESASLGYVGFDPDHLAWDLYTGYADELADACQNWQGSYFQETGSFPYWVQRSWSNEAALLGHDPCVPAPAGPYQGMTLFPDEESTVSVDLALIGIGTTKARGFNVTIGKPLTFHVGFFSDAATGPWTIAYDFPATLPDFDMSGNPLGNGSGTVTIDTTSGQNGDEATVTVTPAVKGEGGFQVMAITWDPPTSPGYLPRYLPVLLVDD